MKDKVTNRLGVLSQEVESLMQERQDMQKRDQEIEVRLHQLVGSIYELQTLMADLDRQPLEEVLQQVLASEQPVRQSTHPSEGVDLDNHQVQLTETEKNSQQQS